MTHSETCPPLFDHFCCRYSDEAEIERVLLVQAPVMPAGLQLDYWEAGGSMGAARSGMEIQNHWGAVDAHVQLSVRTSA